MKHVCSTSKVEGGKRHGEVALCTPCRLHAKLISVSREPEIVHRILRHAKKKKKKNSRESFEPVRSDSPAQIEFSGSVRRSGSQYLELNFSS